MRYRSIQAFCNIRKRRKIHVYGKRTDSCEQSQDKDQGEFLVFLVGIHVVQMYKGIYEYPSPTKVIH